MKLIYRNRDHVMSKDPKLAEALDDVIRHVETVMDQTNTSPAGNVISPPKVQAVNVVAKDGIYDVAVHDNSTAVTRGVNYFVEYSKSPAFDNPTVVDLGASRNWRGQLGNQKLYFRAYSQYPTSERSEPTVHGDPTSPSAVIGGGTVAGPDLQTSNGSGTASGGIGHDGGFGNLPFRGSKEPIKNL